MFIINDFTLLQGDCMERLSEIDDNSIDAIFAAPPYFLSNGGISVQSGKQVCVWIRAIGTKAEHPNISTSSTASGSHSADRNSRITAQSGLAAHTTIFTS